MSRRQPLTELTKIKEQINELSSANEKLQSEIAICHNTEFALLQSEQKLLTLVNKVPVGIFAPVQTATSFLLMSAGAKSLESLRKTLSERGGPKRFIPMT